MIQTSRYEWKVLISQGHFLEYRLDYYSRLHLALKPEEAYTGTRSLSFIIILVDDIIIYIYLPYKSTPPPHGFNARPIR